MLSETSKRYIEDRIKYTTERIVNLLDEIDRLKKRRLELIEEYNKRIDSEQSELKKALEKQNNREL